MNFTIFMLRNKNLGLVKSFFLSFFSICVFFHEHSRFTGQQGKDNAISLTFLYQFHAIHRHLDISQEITAESSTLHKASTRPKPGLFSRCKSVINKLGAIEKSWKCWTTETQAKLFCEINRTKKWVWHDRHCHPKFVALLKVCLHWYRWL